MGAERKWLFSLFLAAFISFLMFLSFISGFSSSYNNAFSSQKPSDSVLRGPGHPPAFAYYIFGGRGDAERIFRLLLAVYHPRNRYLLHISADGGDDERSRLAALVKSVPAVRAFENVDVFGKPDPNTYMGSTNIAAVLRAAAVLLKVGGGWDWFLTLSAMDYPLVTQDGMLILSSFMFGTGVLLVYFPGVVCGLVRIPVFILAQLWSQRIEPIVVDPGFYLARRTQIFHATEKRPMPEAFKVFTGSPWVVLSRSFLEFCIFGWDNLPRTILMYVNNLILSQEVYFHSVICNSPEFKNTTVNADLRYFVWDDPPKMEPHFLNASDYDEMAKSGAAFARQFGKDHPVLDMIDKKILLRGRNRATPGAWCKGRQSWLVDPCSQWGNVNVVKPGPQVKIFEESINKLISDRNSELDTCT
ncbi:Core-2/I-branching beta-1,6-N-acetylglucosaminyltransferase family protein isoform 1 [Dorcoceras hygrometricum]|uniref:Core-2/I-branching beta-1,6-N-acetylglucosaminyltransferase family protein isoform 1 n=1 Tax=Dorcoceras hygrometricum TaxID=472368 RepID=A0A2Z7AHC4_9LAMI|nr:Core-2/I-branching beta-1,6-N-acetylglucosaminyltransferase family protein isoform 1 [Dorcoceras hygrometricum]